LEELIPTNPDIISIKRLFSQFNALEERIISFKIMHEIPIQKSFLKNFRQIEQIALKLIENDAPKFNLFNILGISHLEAKVHTPFLTELLNPDGSHRQGRLFFDAFMKHLFNDAFIPENINNIKVVKEMTDYGNGRMDIAIIYRENNINKEIIIENKIYHHDEKEQLTKYHKYLTETKRLKAGQYHLIYLTPYKTIPTGESISPELYQYLQSIDAISEWGYYEDISPLLESVLPSIKAPVVTQTVYQYIESIEYL